MGNSPVIKTFDTKLDHLLGGGIPMQSFNILAGEPGAGKSIFAHHLLYHYLQTHNEGKVLYLTTLSEPPAKVIRYMQRFTFFDPELFQTRFILDDIGTVIRNEDIEDISTYIVNKVQQIKPNILVVDSFKAIRDLSVSTEVFRRFVYQFAVQLFSQQCTTFLIGEYSEAQEHEGAEFAVADGILTFSTWEQNGEFQRTLQVKKLRGQNPLRSRIPFGISEHGITIQHIQTGHEVLAPEESTERIRTGIKGLDVLLRGGFFPGQAVLISGVSGTGKTTLALQIISQVVQSGDKALYYSFEEPVDDLMKMANRFGWNLQSSIESDQLIIRHILQSDIRVDQNFLEIEQDLKSAKPRWVVIDSLSIFLHRIDNLALYREKMYLMKHLLYAARAVGLIISDIPANDTAQLSRMGVEETVADGTIVLTTTMEDFKRRRYLEVYKQRQTDHIKGRHRMLIQDSGIDVYFAASPQEEENTKTNKTLIFQPVKTVLTDAVRYDSSWLVRGEPGMGKSSLAIQFTAEGLKDNESVLFISADAPVRDTKWRLQKTGVDVDKVIKSNHLRILDAYNSQDPRLDITDPFVFIYYLYNISTELTLPLRIVFDSITPLQVSHSPQRFMQIIQEKNRLLRRQNVTILDTYLYSRQSAENELTLLNGYDVVIDLFAIGEKTGTQSRLLQIAKSRGVEADATPQPYHINPNDGIILDA